MSAPERVTFEGQGLAIRALRFGAPLAKGTLLLLHGYLDAAATWDLCAARLVSAGYSVLALDLRGFGESDRVPPGGYYHFPDYVSDVDAVVRQAFGAEKITLVGHSM